MTIEELKQNIINDYTEWVKVAFIHLKDEIGIRNTSIQNFILKLEQLIENVRKNP